VNIWIEYGGLIDWLFRFALDLLTSIPTVHIIYIFSTSTALVRALRWIRFTRLLKLMSHSRLVRTIAQQETKAGLWADFLVVLKFVLLITILAHILACGWFAIALAEVPHMQTLALHPLWLEPLYVVSLINSLTRRMGSYFQMVKRK
jgi:hypothetical protein